jgi:hypothetical protein
MCNQAQGIPESILISDEDHERLGGTGDHLEYRVQICHHRWEILDGPYDRAGIETG